jgi:hypothetical protein
MMRDKKCTIDMTRFNELNLEKGEAIITRVALVNEIGLGARSGEGKGALFTHCENGVPDSPVNFD